VKKNIDMHENCAKNNTKKNKIPSFVNEKQQDLEKTATKNLTASAGRRREFFLFYPWQLSFAVKKGRVAEEK
jgi:hypothetical protein